MNSGAISLDLPQISISRCLLILNVILGMKRCLSTQKMQYLLAIAFRMTSLGHIVPPLQSIAVVGGVGLLLGLEVHFRLYLTWKDISAGRWDVDGGFGLNDIDDRVIASAFLSFLYFWKVALSVWVGHNYIFRNLARACRWNFVRSIHRGFCKHVKRIRFLLT